MSGTHVIGTPHDTVTDFGAHPTAVARPPATVAWQQAFAAAPAAGAVVSVPAGLTVTYDRTSDVPWDTVCVEPGGKLAVTGGRMTCTQLVVKEGGWLDVTGGEFVFAPKPFRAEDAAQYGCGLLCWGKCTVRGAAKAHRMRLAKAPRTGDAFLDFAAAPAGWRAGDLLAVPQMYAGAQGATSETAVVASVAGARVNLAAPLAGRYEPPLLRDGAAFDLPFVANLTRSVVFRSAAPDGVRGHVQFLHKAEVDLRFCEFREMGRTTLQAGSQIGRYGLHLHHLVKPFFMEGVSVHNAGQKTKWCAAVHDCHFSTVQNCVFRGADHAGLATEEGSESRLTVRGNVALDVGPHSPFGDSAGFWFNGWSFLTAEDNWAYHCRSEWWFPTNLDLNRSFPAPAAAGQYPFAGTVWWAWDGPLKFSGNGGMCCGFGVYLDHRRGWRGSDYGRPVVVENHTSSLHWARAHAGMPWGECFFVYDTDPIVCRNMRAHTAPLSFYPNEKTRYEDCKVLGGPLGVFDQTTTLYSGELVNCHFETDVGVRLVFPATLGAGPFLEPGRPYKDLLIQGCTYGPATLPVEMGGTFGGLMWTPCAPVRVRVLAHGGNPQENWLLYWDNPQAGVSQAAGQPLRADADILAESGGSWLTLGAPERGLTNAAAEAKWQWRPDPADPFKKQFRLRPPPTATPEPGWMAVATGGAVTPAAAQVPAWLKGGKAVRLAAAAQAAGGGEGPLAILE